MNAQPRPAITAGPSADHDTARQMGIGQRDDDAVAIAGRAPDDRIDLAVGGDGGRAHRLP